jgi:hypothetical protein
MNSEKLKPGYRLRDGDQIPTRPVAAREIMASPLFKKGADDVRAGKPYPADYDSWSHEDKLWAYERGRAWATAAPRRVPLMINGKISVAALSWFEKAAI